MATPTITLQAGLVICDKTGSVFCVVQDRCDVMTRSTSTGQSMHAFQIDVTIVMDAETLIVDSIPFLSLEFIGLGATKNAATST